MKWLHYLFLVVVFLMPGLAVYKGYYSLSIFKTKYISQSWFTIVGYSLIPAVIVHVCSIYIATLTVHFGLWGNSCGVISYDAIGELCLLNRVGHDQLWGMSKLVPEFLFYGALSLFIGYSLGVSIRIIVRNWGLDLKYGILRFPNRWYYLLTGETLYFTERTLTRKAYRRQIEKITVRICARLREEKGIFEVKGVVEDFCMTRDETGLDYIKLRQASMQRISNSTKASITNNYYNCKYPNQDRSSQNKDIEVFVPVDDDYYILKFEKVVDFSISYDTDSKVLNKGVLKRIESEDAKIIDKIGYINRYLYEKTILSGQTKVTERILYLFLVVLIITIVVIVILGMSVIGYLLGFKILLPIVGVTLIVIAIILECKSSLVYIDRRINEFYKLSNLTESLPTKNFLRIGVDFLILSITIVVQAVYLIVQIFPWIYGQLKNMNIEYKRSEVNINWFLYFLKYESFAFVVLTVTVCLISQSFYYLYGGDLGQALKFLRVPALIVIVLSFLYDSFYSYKRYVNTIDIRLLNIYKYKLFVKLYRKELDRSKEAGNNCKISFVKKLDVLKDRIKRFQSKADDIEYVLDRYNADGTVKELLSKEEEDLKRRSDKIMELIEELKQEKNLCKV